jgi:hypothetical protein
LSFSAFGRSRIGQAPSRASQFGQSRPDSNGAPGSRKKGETGAEECTVAEPQKPNLLIACGALANEIVALQRLNGWSERLHVTCLPAIWHNTPDKIPEGVRRKIRAGRNSDKYDRIYVAYADCGTGGLLDDVLREEGAERIAGPHCYQFYAGEAAFEKLMDEELGSFFLTDYLARHFDRLIWKGFGLDRHPDLKEMVFGNYKRLVFLAQIEDAAMKARAEEIARRLDLAFEYRVTGYGELAQFMAEAANAGQMKKAS